MNPQVIFFTLLTLISNVTSFDPKFTDVTVKAGIQIRPNGPGTSRKLKKYGGPAIADLDGDGFYDLILVHHGPDSAELYFSQRDGTFVKSNFRSRRDNHATTPFRLPGTLNRFFTLIPGGNRGFRPNPPVVYQISNNREITNVVAETGVDFYTARGRAVVAMPLQKRDKKPDLLYLNAASDPQSCPGCTDPQYDPFRFRSYKARPMFKPRKLRGFKPTLDNDLGMAIDIDGDRQPELLTWRTLHIHKLIGYFKFKDISETVLGEYAYAPGVNAVAEIDYDNDGDFDLYIARDKTFRRPGLPDIPFPDLLLENRGGKFVNVALEAKIPQNTVSRGVTVGDFNNDGYMDLYVSILRGKPDMLLMNNGDGTFRNIDIGIGKQGALGDNAMAVDYDNDGRVDIIRSEGSLSNYDLGGQFRILKNVPSVNDGIGNYVKVRVGLLKNQTSQHAVVVVIAKGLKTMQKVGPAGASIPHSYFDTLHFGIGSAKKAQVNVTWLNGETRSRVIPAGTIGRFGKY